MIAFYYYNQRETAKTTISPATPSRMKPSAMPVMSLCLVVVERMIMIMTIIMIMIMIMRVFPYLT